MIRYIPLFVCLVFISCTNVNDKTGVIIEKDKMAEVIRDITLAETYVDFFLKKDTTIKKDTLLKREIEKVLTLHNIDVKTFSASYRYYKNQPDIFKLIVDSASAWFSKDRTSLLPVNK